MDRLGALALFLAFSAAGSAWCAEPAGGPALTDVYVSGTEGYHTFRIPSVVVTAKGTLLAFCEGRKFWATDQSPTDLVLSGASTAAGRGCP